MGAPFKAGQTVYDRSGRVYQFQGMMDNSAIVCQIFEGQGWEGELDPYPSELASAMDLGSLSVEPPTAAIVAEVLKAENELKRIKDAIADATAEARNAEKQNAERLAKLKRFKALSRIEDFLEGNITHFVTRSQYGGRIKVEAFEETMHCKNDYGRFDGDIKLLSLFGRRGAYPQHGNVDGDLLWKVNQYYDGSGGGWHIVQPCLSEEEAKSIAAGWLDERWAEHRLLEDRLAKSHWLREYIDSANALGLTVPDDIIADFEAHKETAREAAIQKAKADLENLLSKQVQP
mgnify:CR=1 FL=1